MPSRKSKFQLGYRVPYFVLPDSEHSRFSLREHVGRGPLLLGFIRGTWCPFCRRFMQQVLQSIEEMQSLGCEVVLIASQPLAPILRFSRQEKLPFRILADADRAVTREYGVYQALGLMGVNVARPAAFLLNEEGRILYQFVGSATDRPPIPEILKMVRTSAGRKGSHPAAGYRVKA